jgi:hypothetical protein
MTTTNQASLLKPTLASIILAIFVLILFILPAEYNVDPTGIGHKLGLTQLATTAQAETTNQAKKNKTIGNQSQGPSTETVFEDTVEVIVPAHKGIEYKFYLKEHQTMTYQWQTNGSELYLDLHGEPEGDTTGYYESYTIATATQMSGQFTAPFAGIHGWYWKNTSDNDIKVNLTSKGPYKVVGLKK